MRYHHIHVMAGGTALLAVQFSLSTLAEPIYSGYVETGIEYRSNPIITQLDVAAGEPDTAALLQAGISADSRVDDTWSLYAGYDLDARRHRTLNQFDLTLHQAHLGVRHDLAAVTLGLEHQYVRASLAEDPFLSQQNTTLYAERLLGASTVLRAGLSAGNRRYDDLTKRDAALRGVRVDLYWAPSATGLFASSLAIDDADGRDEAFRYAARTLGMSYRQGFDAFGRHHEAGLGWQYQQRDYPDAAPSGITPMVEDRLQLEASIEMGLNDRVALRMAAERGDVSFARPGVDYNDERFSLTVKAAF